MVVGMPMAPVVTVISVIPFPLVTSFPFTYHERETVFTSKLYVFADICTSSRGPGYAGERESKMSLLTSASSCCAYVENGNTNIPPQKRSSMYNFFIVCFICGF